MASLPSRVAGVLGDTSLSRFDALIIGSGAGGGMAARVLAAVGGKKVLVLEAGPNYFLGLDDPAPGMPKPLFSNDEIKMSIRGLIRHDPFLEPRTFRSNDSQVAVAHPDVNVLPKTVGGASVHSDVKFPRFNAVDFYMASELQAKGLQYPDTNFADWPLTYEELEPYYNDCEEVIGIQGSKGSDPFESPRSKEFPMPPGVSMYVSEILNQGARAKGYYPFAYPGAHNSRPYRGRPPCNDCGFCSGYGCPNNSKGSAAVTTLREALLSGNCQVRFNCQAVRLLHNNGTHVTGVEYIDPDGKAQTASADVYILAASPIESARLCLLSDNSAGLGNSSGMVGRNLMFHTQHYSVGIYPQRLHGERGKSVTHGMSDFRGVKPGGAEIDPNLRLGGVIEFGTNSEAITAAKNNLQALAFLQLQGRAISLKQMLVNSPFLAHLAAMIMQAEDAPRLNNRIDLDPTVKDVFGRPAARITYSLGSLENEARAFYVPKMLEIHRAAGAQYGFTAPIESPPNSRHIMGTMRMGHNPAASVCDAFGKLHDVDNLYNMDGGVFVTGSGYNPLLTINALAERAAANLIFPGNPERVLGH